VTNLESSDILGARPDLHLGKPVLEVELLVHHLRAALDPDGEETSGETTTVREHGDPLALELSRARRVEERREGAVERRCVEVTELLGRDGAGLRLGVEHVLGCGHEGLLDVLVEEGLLAGEVSDGRGDGGEALGGGVGEVVVVELPTCVSVKVAMEDEEERTRRENPF
jgi:hypothetical protein